MSSLFIIGLLLVLGVILLVMEIFLLPGFVVGLIGILFMVIAIVKAFLFSTEAGILVFVIAVLASTLAICWFMKSKTLNKLSLHDAIDSKVEPLKDIEIKAGDRAITLSRLAPMGKIKVGEKIIEAKSIKDFIDDGVEVEIVSVENTCVEVMTIK